MSRSLHLPIYRGDPLLLILGLALISIGLVAIASASIEYSDFHFGNPWHHTERHALYLMAGFAAGGLAYCLPTDDRPLYKVRFLQSELWPSYSGSARDSVELDLYEHWLEKV